jgi:hypothetical protein
MLVPGLTFFIDGRMDVAAGNGQIPDFINQGFGFMNNGALAFDTGAMSGNVYARGFRLSPAGALYAIDEALATPPFHFIDGLLVEESGRLIIDLLLVVDHFVNGNPVSVTGSVPII